MRLLFLPALSLILLGSCTSTDFNPSVAASNEILEYNLEGNRYAIVVSVGGWQAKTIQEAKRIAHLRAAELTVNRKSRYFFILSEEKVSIIASESERAALPPQVNLYQNDILERGYDRESINRMPAGAKESPGYKITFEIFKEKPLGRPYVDACDITNC